LEIKKIKILNQGFIPYINLYGPVLTPIKVSQDLLEKLLAIGCKIEEIKDIKIPIQEAKVPIIEEIKIEEIIEEVKIEDVIPEEVKIEEAKAEEIVEENFFEEEQINDEEENEDEIENTDMDILKKKRKKRK